MHLQTQPLAADASTAGQVVINYVVKQLWAAFRGKARPSAIISEETFKEQCRQPLKSIGPLFLTAFVLLLSPAGTLILPQRAV
jgi:hypothetical protein